MLLRLSKRLFRPRCFQVLRQDFDCPSVVCGSNHGRKLAKRQAAGPGVEAPEEHFLIIGLLELVHQIAVQTFEGFFLASVSVVFWLACQILRLSLPLFFQL